MRYLVVSDIHSNLEALEQVLETAQGLYDRVVCLGDLVGYGPDPNAVVEKVRQISSVVIRGNHDKACCGITNAVDFNPLARLATLWTRQQLNPDHLDYLRQLPEGPGSYDGFKMVHGSVANEDEYVVDLEHAFKDAPENTASVTFFGHTHLQGGFILTPQGAGKVIENAVAPGTGKGRLAIRPDSRYLINPGSVGQPRDRDWRAAFAIYDNHEQCVEYYRTAYDLPKTQEKMLQAGLPAPLISRLELGR